jgi:hypothetical protein
MNKEEGKKRRGREKKKRERGEGEGDYRGWGRGVLRYDDEC